MTSAVGVYRGSCPGAGAAVRPRRGPVRMLRVVRVNLFIVTQFVNTMLGLRLCVTREKKRSIISSFCLVIVFTSNHFYKTWQNRSSFCFLSHRVSLTYLSAFATVSGKEIWKNLTQHNNSLYRYLFFTSNKKGVNLQQTPFVTVCEDTLLKPELIIRKLLTVKMYVI